MGDFLNKLKTKTRIAEATLSGKIVEIPKDVKMFNCPNHFQTHNGKVVKIKYPISITNPKMKDFTCDCRTVYKFV